LFQLTSTKLCLSSAYHPQSSGQTERVNQCLEAYLRRFVHACPKQWSSWLPVAEFWYNTSYHSALGKSPFEVLYGHAPSHFGLDTADQCTLMNLKSLMHTRQEMLQQVKMHLLRAQQRMKRQADKGRSERTFDVGAQVYLKLQLYCQTSVAKRKSHKLAFRFFDPFRIVKKINPVAYQLALPANSAIHLVFHVSQLKPAIGANTPVSSVIPDLSQAVQIPEEVLDSRLTRRGNKVIPQLLVRWSGWPALLATWEDELKIRMQFPSAPAWGQANCKGGGYVSNLAGEDEAQKEDARSGAIAERRPRRSKSFSKPNTKYYGLQ
jgi:hypothetical protein